MLSLTIPFALNIVILDILDMQHGDIVIIAFALNIVILDNDEDFLCVVFDYTVCTVYS